MTDFLCASPGFITGISRNVDLGGVLRYSSYNMSATPAEADTRAIKNDWQAVGRDLRWALEKGDPKATTA